MRRQIVFALLTAAVLVSGCRKAATPPAPQAAQPAPPAAGAPPAQPGQPGAPPAQPPAKPVPAQLPTVVARVNGEPVERWELENAVKRAEQGAGSAMPAERRDEILRSVLDHLVAYHVLAQESRARKLTATDAEVDARVDQIRQSYPSPEGFNVAMTAQGLTVDMLKKQTRMSIEAQKLIELEVNAKIAVTETDADAFYKQNIERFKEGDSVHAAHILIAVPQGADPAVKEQAKAKAQQLLKQLKGGANFAKLAKENSADPGSAANGGDLGFFPKGQMTPAFEEAAFKLKNNAVSDVVETPFGFHIIKTLGRRGPRTAPLEEVKPQIMQFLTNGQRQTKLEQLVEQTKAKTKVEILI